MDIDLSGRRAVVTGGSRGIGAAIVTALAQRNARVAFCARDVGGLEALATSLRSCSASVEPFVADMADPEQVNRFLDFVESEFGQADILINNVGQSPSRNFLLMDDHDWMETFQVNLFAAVQCTKRLVPAMRAQRWGRVVMIASAAAKYPDAAIVDYAASKAAMVATARALARKYAADNVLINSVLPGLIDTSMWQRASAEIAAATKRTREEVMEQMARTVPLGRFGTASEVANLVLFLVSEDAAYLTGATIDLDGGRGDYLF